MGPGAPHFAVNEPTIKSPSGPCSERRDPVEPCFGARCSDCESGRNETNRDGVFYARRRQLPFNTQHPLADLVVEPCLTAAQKATVATPTGADMTTQVESGPVIGHRYHWRGAVDRNRYGVCGVGRNLRRHHRRRNYAEREEPLYAHDIAPNAKWLTAREAAVGVFSRQTVDFTSVGSPILKRCCTSATFPRPTGLRGFEEHGSNCAL